jgi:hypothetical protein
MLALETLALETLALETLAGGTEHGPTRNIDIWRRLVRRLQASQSIFG